MLDGKKLGFIVLNSTRNEGTAFRSDYNKASIISKDGVTEYEKKPKSKVADIIDRGFTEFEK